MSFIFYYWHFRLVYSQISECVNWLFHYRVHRGFGFCGSGPASWVGLSISALGGRSLTEGEAGFSLLEVFVTEKWISPWLSSHGPWLIVHFGSYYLVLEVVILTINLVFIHSAQRQDSLLLLHPWSSSWAWIWFKICVARFCYFVNLLMQILF